MGEWRKILVVAEYANEMAEVLDFFDWSPPDCVEGIMVLRRNAVLVETRYRIEEIDAEFRYLQVSIFMVDEPWVSQLLEPALAEEVERAARAMDISDDIDYFLDLAVDRGGVARLTSKEMRRLEELSRR